MKSIKYNLIWIVLVSPLFVLSQNLKKDTIKLKEVIVTATKTKKQLSNATVPVSLIKAKEINQMAALNLQDILDENTGLSTQHYALGVGIQMQGLDSDYTLIMVDGKPLIGRLNGVLDLSRVSTENIAQIEIVKGPSSVLYGSDALAGVVNIITKKKKNNSLKIGTKYSNFNTLNLYSNANLNYKKVSSSLFVNYYKTDGYTLNSNYEGYDSSSYYNKTISPHNNYNITNNISFNITEKAKFTIDSYYFKENQNYRFIQSDKLVDGKGSVNDWQIAPNFEYKINKKLFTKINYQYTNYQTNNNEIFKVDNSEYHTSFFKQDYQQIEVQNDYDFTTKNKTSIGLGYINEGVSTSKLINDNRQQTNNIYAFAQHQLQWHKFDFVLGARFEKHDAYTNQFNPKFSFLYRFKPTLQFRGSIGRGFKKPTFKQLFFNYTNEAIGYTVFGTTYLEDGIANLIANNQIEINPENNQPVIYDAYYTILNKNGVIKPESSLGYNFGVKYTGLNNTIIDANIFRNDLKNLIDTTPVALKTNGWRAYSYLNLNSVYTTGFNINIKHYLNNNIKISIGYQYLEAKDKTVLDKIKNEGIFAQDLVTHQSYRISKKDYGGLFNRSKHTGNFKIFVKNIYKNIQANLRVLYTGKYGFSDLNNNGILDIDQEYTDGYFLVNTAFSKSFLQNKLHLKIGVDNLLDFTYIKPEYTITSLPGRIFYTTINYTF